MSVPRTSPAKRSASAASSFVRFSPMRMPILSLPNSSLMAVRFFAVSLTAA